MDLSKRERIVISAGGGIVAVFFFVVWVFLPVIHHRSGVDESILLKNKEITKAYELSSEIKAAQRTLSGVDASRTKGGSLFGYMEDLSERLNIKEYIEYMKPVGGGSSSKEVVEIRIRGIYEDDLINLLYGIDTGPMSMKIKRLNIRRVDGEGNLDITFQVVAYG